VSGSAAKSSGILRKITPTSAEPRDAPIANRSQQKLQVGPRPLRTPHGDRQTARMWLKGSQPWGGGTPEIPEPPSCFWIHCSHFGLGDLLHGFPSIFILWLIFFTLPMFSFAYLLFILLCENVSTWITLCMKSAI
jgi:hypothetical protein